MAVYRFCTVFLAVALVGCSTLGKVSTGGAAKSDKKESSYSNKSEGDDIGSLEDFTFKKSTAPIKKWEKPLSFCEKKEETIAHSISDSLDKETRMAKPESRYTKRLERLLEKHQQIDGISLEFGVYLASNVNVLAFADGNLRVYSGLMDKLTDDELIAVLAHQVGHLKAGHLKAKTKKACSKTDTEHVKENFVKSTFSKKEEREANAYVRAFMSKYAYDKYASGTAQEKLIRLSKQYGLDSEEAEFVALHSEGEKTSAALAQAEKQEEKKLSRSSSLERKKIAKTVEIPKRKATNKSKKIGVVPTGYYLQLSAETEQAKALRKVNELLSSGLEAASQKAVVEGIKYYRVLVGPYQSRKAASVDSHRVKGAHDGESDPFIQHFR